MNATGTLRVLEAARVRPAAGGPTPARIVFAASSSAYGNQPELPKHEGQLPQLLSPYAAAKLAGEIYFEAFASSGGNPTITSDGAFTTAG
ncbi:MAG: GDP-mannose 4,6-dehydratase [Chloroflexi bacterium]|nr:GDP-mannose 4,6-dehydratase [Chloroflexota bacterium]